MDSGVSGKASGLEGAREVSISVPIVSALKELQEHLSCALETIISVRQRDGSQI